MRGARYSIIVHQGFSLYAMFRQFGMVTDEIMGIAMGTQFDGKPDLGLWTLALCIYAFYVVIGVVFIPLSVVAITAIILGVFIGSVVIFPFVWIFRKYYDTVRDRALGTKPGIAVSEVHEKISDKFCAYVKYKN